MTTAMPSIEFFVGISEELSNVSLRRSKETGIRNVLLIFDTLKSLEKFKSFTQQTYGDLRLIDCEGEISVKPSSLKIIWGGDEGDELRQVRCGFEIEQDDHWDRFMRFMNRYAEANGMGYQDTNK
ncbi:photosystem II reaction center protein Psb28 [Rippkaea orientalis PCC 8801]|uniref:Photosystem II reaction center Psb28 protein n=1 Tax=Rippkaea orientalis (strain PCC 8801 / RF-1) TaxID=41431 RepID=B7K1J8_RIPO1|nr:photosystem II reaction center protein Psb28 [Rippkaea orientalis]ACK67540.1 photosystem II reaction center protein Psb28 [Rippkaea orientalis PCC 8801]